MVTAPPQPQVVGFQGYVPELCVLHPEQQDLPTHLYARPTEVTVGRWGELNIFACPEEPSDPHRRSIQ